jgi:uncharacterized phiE125 gp8 family phage protein
MSIQTTLQPVAEPITLAEAKLHLRVETSVTADDELIKSIITAARSYCEMVESRAYMIRTMQLKLDEFEDTMRLPYPPLISVDSVQYIDSAGATQTLATTVYEVDTTEFPGEIRLAYEQTWPSKRAVRNSVVITYKAGFSTAFTAADTDILTVGNMIFATGDVVRIETDQNELPSPLAIGTDYYVRTVSGSTFKLATTNSDTTIVNITDAGTGTHFIALARTGLVPAQVKAAIKLVATHLYEMRQPEITGQAIQKIDFGIQNLLFKRSEMI